MFAALVFLPESPVWLKTKHQHEKAAASAKWLHLSGFEMADTRQMDKLPKSSPTTSEDQKLFSKKIFFSRPILQPLGIGMALLTFQQFSGIDAIIFFTVEIFRNAGVILSEEISHHQCSHHFFIAGSSLNSHDATIIVGFVQVLSNFCSLFFVDRYGRKPLLIISGIIMAASTGVMGAAFYLNSIGNTCCG
jgi:facilitated trehalose transporter